MTAHVKLLGILQIAWGAIGLLLGASTLMLAIGAVAVGMTTTGQEIPAGVTALAFAACAAALLQPAPAMRGPDRRFTSGARRAVSQPSGSLSRISSFSPLGPRSGSTRSGCCCTMRFAACLSRTTPPRRADRFSTHAGEGRWRT